jgi:hypothetical protein
MRCATVLRVLAIIATANLIKLLAGCTTVPPLETGPTVAVSQVVQRVKCELAHAVEPYLIERKEFDWFQRWIAGVDLTLIVSDGAGATPSVKFINPLPQVVLKNIGTFSQNFTFGVGGGATKQV